MPPLIRPSSIDDAGDAVRQVIRAYHASPYDFDQFDARKIGTGEGNRSYSHGLYFAQDPAVRESYWRQFVRKKQVNRDWLAAQEDLEKYFAPGNIVPSYGGQDRVLGFNPGDPRTGLGWSATVISVGPDGAPQIGARPRVHSTHPRVVEADQVLGRPLARRYEVEIDHPEESLLDWDAPVVDQPRGIQEALGKFAQPSGDFLGGPESWLGKHAYHAVADARRGPARASKALAKEGIPGVRYWDGASRRAQSGNRNFVIFPGAEDSIRILRKFAVPGVVGTGAAAMSGDE